MAGTNRAQKVGIAYEVEKKQELNYDREETAGVPQAICNWINAIVGSDHENIPATDWKSFNTHIRDGVMLCKLINKLLDAASKPKIMFQKKVMSPFVAMTNIENFNKGCSQYGLKEESTFQSGDLWEVRKAGFYNVISCLHLLGFEANAKCFMPAYTGEVTRTIDRE